MDTVVHIGFKGKLPRYLDRLIAARLEEDFQPTNQHSPQETEELRGQVINSLRLIFEDNKVSNGKVVLTLLQREIDCLNGSIQNPDLFGEWRKEQLEELETQRAENSGLWEQTPSEDEQISEIDEHLRASPVVSYLEDLKHEIEIVMELRRGKKITRKSTYYFERTVL